MSLANAKASLTAIAIALPVLLSAVVWSTTASAQNRDDNPAQTPTATQICDSNADFALGREDYPAAIILHRKLLQAQPANALAHYHLGFAYGMTGRTSNELTEYLTAARLGLRSWDLFLNLGLAYLDQHHLERAAEAFATSAALGPEHSEAHFNLALADESTHHLKEALREIETAQRLAPQDPDVANSYAIICVESGDSLRAHSIWTHLVKFAPNYAPARSNLQILNRSFGNDRQSGPSTRLSYAQEEADPSVSNQDLGNLETVISINSERK